MINGEVWKIKEDGSKLLKIGQNHKTYVFIKVFDESMIGFPMRCSSMAIYREDQLHELEKVGKLNNIKDIQSQLTKEFDEFEV